MVEHGFITHSWGKSDRCYLPGWWKNTMVCEEPTAVCLRAVVLSMAVYNIPQPGICPCVTCGHISTLLLVAARPVGPRLPVSWCLHMPYVEFVQMDPDNCVCVCVGGGDCSSYVGRQTITNSFV